MMLRHALLLAAALLTGCADDWNGEALLPPPLGVEVSIDSGMVLGQDHLESDVWEWLAIPFAEPPVGALRWRAPQPVPAWDGVMTADTLGEPCSQTNSGVFTGIEDCLHLNVWRPQTEERDLPVYVWIHGGSNTSGANSYSAYQGDRLAQNSNVVVVSIQYRLGALGWLYYEPLHTGDPLDDSGNYGLLDIIESLKWIQNNIEAFGGDSGNVIVTGESAGAINIMSLLLSQEASGLFHKAIIQSGLPNNPSTEEGQAAGAELYDNLTALMGAPLSDPTNDEIAGFMREATAEEILSGYNGPVYSFTDGAVIPAEGNDQFATGDYANKVPILVGTNRDEFKLWTNPLFLNALPGVSEEVRDGVGRYVSDLWRVVGADQFATEITAAADQPEVYVYRFNWGSPDENGFSPLPGDFGDTLGACHAGEITFVLGNWEEWADPRVTPVLFTPDNAAGRENMSGAIMDYFAAFAHSGNPNGGNLASWEPFTTSGDFKAIEIDVDPNDSSVKLTVDTEVYTEESVLADLNANLEEPTRSEVLAIILALGWLD